LAGTVTPGNIVVNNSAGDYTISGGGAITGVGALTKNGSRTLTLATANSFSGGSTLNGGTLAINANTALGTGSLVINAGALDNTSGQPVIVANVPQEAWNTDILFGGGSNLDMGVATVSFGSISTGANRTVTVNANTLTVGSITDGGNNNGLIKAGVGTLVMGGNNSFSGPVAINTGVLKVNTFGGLGTNTAVGATVASGAALDIGGLGATDVANGFGSMPITISGDGIGGTGAIINSATAHRPKHSRQSTLPPTRLSAEPRPWKSRTAQRVLTSPIIRFLKREQVSSA